MHREFLKEKYPARYNELILSGELCSYLADVNEQAQERLERLDAIITQMKVAEGVSEVLKAHDQMEWVRRCNSIRNRAEEIVLSEIVYG